jgi:2-dehydropantoate 2-reductase
MRIAVFGSGGVGGYFGGRLAQAGEEVFFIARGAHLDAIRQSGLAVESLKGSFVIHPARAESDPAAIGPVDGVLVATKAWQVPEAALAIRPLMGPDTLVIPLQNGVESVAQLTEVLGAAQVVSGLCHISSQVGGPGLIRHTGMEPMIYFNWPDGHADARLDQLCAAFKRVGVNAQIPADILFEQWSKFIFVAPVSGVGAVTRAPVGVQRSVPETRRLLLAVIQETAAVGRAMGVALPESMAEDILRYVDTLPAATVASMHRDITEGRPSELEAQTGAVVRLGQAHGVPTPANSFLYACLLPLEQRARGKLAF